MRRTVFLASVLLPVLVAAGCASQVPRADGPAAPITPSPVGSAFPTTAAPATTRSSPTSSPSSSSPSPSKTPATHSTPTILGHDGFGALKLGMSSKKAQATGLITPWTGTAAAGCSLYSRLKGSSGDRGRVYFSGSTGVEIIDAYPGISTPEGIHIGSTKAQVFRAYPDWTNAQDQDPKADGIGGADVPGNSKAFYRIWIKNGKVIELTLQLGTENCYE
jgi:hypothetical protein